MANHTALFLHLVWATAGRQGLLTPEVEADVHACIASKCRQLRCRPIAVGGMPDHVHLLIELHPTVSVAVLAKEVKGASSYRMTHVLAPSQAFMWQGGYGAFTLRGHDLRVVASYIRNQQRHHTEGSLLADLERIPPPGTTRSG